MDSSRDISSIFRKPLTARFRISAVKQELSMPILLTKRRKPGPLPAVGPKRGITGFLGGSFPQRIQART
jgi:hypothetical protein